MKIACIGYMHGFGGAERQLISLANQLAARSHEIYFIILAEDKICYNLDPSIKILSLLYAEKGNAVQRIIRRKFALTRTLKKLKCDIVINFNFQSAYLLSFVSRKDIGKIVYSERGDPGDKEYQGLMGLIRNFVLSRIDGYVFQSEGARKFFKNKYVLKNGAIIPNACFNTYEPFEGQRRNVIVTVGRLSHQKNQTLLINSFAQIADKYPDYNLEIIGDGELKDTLLRQIESLNLNDRVILKGTSKNVSDAIRDASLFVLSSDFEGIPNALIEAMSLGLPCISTDCRPGGARVLITDNYDGMIVPLGDTTALAKAMDYCLSHPLQSLDMGRRAMDISQRLSPQNIYNKWEEFLYKLKES